MQADQATGPPGGESSRQGAQRTQPTSAYTGTPGISTTPTEPPPTEPPSTTPKPSPQTLSDASDEDMAGIRFDPSALPNEPSGDLRRRGGPPGGLPSGSGYGGGHAQGYEQHPGRAQGYDQQGRHAPAGDPGDPDRDHSYAYEKPIDNTTPSFDNICSYGSFKPKKDLLKVDNIPTPSTGAKISIFGIDLNSLKRKSITLESTENILKRMCIAKEVIKRVKIAKGQAQGYGYRQANASAGDPNGLDDSDDSPREGKGEDRYGRREHGYQGGGNGPLGLPRGFAEMSLQETPDQAELDLKGTLDQADLIPELFSSFGL
ncbi:hypothetical protein LZ554_009582 [Drepanopeziza brunnea f. sp. 'monogermtubi']|nr:hypothetical protein LZ554_009582 [Drepanopeziza brunnea f. sp. 'monogermtubi']